MQRIESIQPDATAGRRRELFEAVRQSFGIVPNAVKLMANSSAVLESYLAFSAAMSQAKIGEKLQTQIKLNTSEANSCDYCRSILSAIGPKAGLTAEEIVGSRRGEAADRRTRAALQFAREVMKESGRVSDRELEAVREAGFDEAEIVEMVASVVLACFTNFLNNLADTELDIPRVPELGAACQHSACSVS